METESGNSIFLFELLTGDVDSIASIFSFTLRSRRNFLVSFKELVGRNLLRSATGVELLPAVLIASSSTSSSSLRIL